MGALIAVLFLYYFAPRYTTLQSGDVLIKQDKWSGDSWRFMDGQWKKMMSLSRDWAKIDGALLEALHIPSDGVERTNALSLLRKKDPFFQDLADDELLERIKLVYSKEVLVNLYLRNFLNIEKELRKNK